MKEILDKAKQHQLNCDKIRRAHYIAWERQSKWNRWLGIPVVTLMATASTLIYLSTQFNELTWMPIVAAILSLVATILSAIQTFLKPSSQAEAHKAAAARYASMKREFELFLLKYTSADSVNRDQVLEALKLLNAKLDFHAENCVALPDRAMNSAEEELMKGN